MDGVCAVAMPQFKGITVRNMIWFAAALAAVTTSAQAQKAPTPVDLTDPATVAKLVQDLGYKAELKGNQVQFALGYSHPIIYDIPEGVNIQVDTKAGKVTVSGADRQKVGQVAAEIRNMRSPDPYKAKGVKYAGEILRRKVGKAGAAAE